MERLKQALSAAGIAYKENEPLSAHCTFRIGGPADVFILPENEAQLCAAIKLAKEANVKYYLLGNGSNILFEDAGYRGAVINVSAMKSAIGILENICFPGKDPSLTYDAVVVGADKMLSSLCMTALENSLTGLEFAYGIPGTVGGAVYMNAGAYGGEMKDVLVSVRYLTAEGESVEVPAEQLDLSYRHSIFEEIRLHASSSYTSNFFFVRQKTAAGTFWCFHLKHCHKRSICADTVILSICCDHTAVKSAVTSFARRNDLQFC